MAAEDRISDPAPLDADLRTFLDRLAEKNLLLRVKQEVDPHLEMTEICHRLLLQGGPAVLFEKPKGHSMPVLGNLFGTPQRIVMALGREQVSDLRQIGQWLAELRQPQPPGSLKEVLRHWPLLRRVLQMRPREISSPPCQQVVWEGKDVDLSRLPIQTCWPQDVGPLITWGLTITRGPRRKRLNIGIYRQQVIGPNRLIMRWLAQRGGALDYADHCAAHPQEPFPVAVVLGADPATTLAAVTPVPDSLSEFQFAGLLRGARSEVARCLSHDLVVPAQAEMVLEGHIHPDDTALEGPFGDHTGYYNEAERYPVLTLTRITMRKQALYHSTYTGKPPDEPSVLGAALNEVFIPLLQQTFPEIVDFYLPPEGCSYRFACVAIRKEYPGHAKRVMFGIWSVLRQFLYTKFILVTDADVNIRSWQDVIWALTTRVDARRDVMVVDDTPMDALDFASPQAGLSAKMGIDATHKWPGEVSRAWGRLIVQDPHVSARVDELWRSLGLG